MAPPSSSDSDIMSTLMNEDFEEFEEENAVEAVLTLDEVTVQVDQFDQSASSSDTFQFIESSGPTLSETKNYQMPDEVQLSKSDAPSKEVDFVVPSSDPLEQVAEPVHTGQGALFSVSSESDFDLKEVHKSSLPIPGKTNMDPQIISDAEEITEVDLAVVVNKDDLQTDIPDLPEGFEASIVENQVVNTNTPEIPEISQPLIATPDVPEIPDSVVETPEIPEISQPIIATPDVPEIPDGVVETPEIPDIPEQPPVNSSVSKTPTGVTDTPEIPDIPETVSKPAPTPQHNNRIWPWPAKQAWDERQVYREVVSLLELVKNGKLVQAAKAIDKLGPHLDDNLDMLTHIGTVMRYLGREEHLQWMLRMAQTVYPNDQRVSTAVKHLSN